MEAKLHSFFDIFDTGVEDAQGNIQVNKIVIPVIQRDYAQGRTSPEIARVRKRFLDSLYRAVTEEPVTLDFIYGDIDREQFWSLAKFKYPTHQISFHTISALDTLTFMGSEEVYGNKK